MPPPGRPRPEKAIHDGFAAWLEAGLDRVAAANPNPGRTEPFHRLNRTEYQNVIRDLLHLRVDVESLLPPDDASYGFDNIAGVLKMSPTLMERYLSAAQKISRAALGTPPPFPNVDYFRVADDLQQDDQLEGLPVGTRGGLRIRYTFPTDGEYVIKARLARDLNESVPAYDEPQHLEVSLDGERLQLFTMPGVSAAAPRAAVVSDDSDGAGGAEPAAAPARPAATAQKPAATGQKPGGAPAPRPRAAITQIEQNGPRVGGREREERNHADQKWDVRVRVKAGERDLMVTFLKRTSALDETTRLPFERPYPAGVNIAETRKGLHLRSVEVVGPYNSTGAGDSPSQRRILVCRPAAPSEETGCARTILSTLARRAYRRPVTDAGHQAAAGGISGRPRRRRVRGRRRAGPDAAAGQPRVPVPRRARSRQRRPEQRLPHQPDWNWPSRLSFFLWSSIPDDELLDAAAKGQLRDPAVLARQVSGCLRIGARRRSSRISRGSGSTCAIFRRPARWRRCFRTSTTACGRRCCAKRSSSSTASCARIAGRSSC